MSPTVTLLLGLVLLFFGGELLVKGSVALALKIRISTFVVGMTIVSFATSAPELFVSLQALLEGSSNIALGNVIGSNIANITLVLGVTAMIFRVQISQQTISFNFPMLLVSSLVFGGVLYYFNGVPQIVGYLFITSLLLFIFIVIKKSRKDHEVVEDKLLEGVKHDPLYKSIALLVIGVVLLKYGADYLVNGAITIANHFKVSDRIIAVTIVAVGTSIPELATSIVAAFKKENNLAVGNLIGSNIFNILAVLGVTSVIQNIAIDDIAILHFDYLWMIAITFIVGFLIYILSKRQISRKEGGMLFLLYIAYIYFNLL
ncbi:calcium/sodium antiporter [Flavobacteriales bacterium]|nr:calcium/sodium antiporter [Flavobacteriales bacterium]